MSDWHTHVFTSTYTADVSGVCSVMYELGGMTVLHDPSGCNSTYTTHDEPRWYDTDSMMYCSGLDEMAAVFGDDSVIIHDTEQAAEDLHPRFITLCGASIPHIIAFDYKGVARMIENDIHIPVVPVPTDGLKSYVSGVGLATREWLKRFAYNGEEKIKYSVNLLGVTPIDFSRQEIVDALKQELTLSGHPVNCVFAMGDTFDHLRHMDQGCVNLCVSSAGRLPARYMLGKMKIPYVEGLPVGAYMRQRVSETIDLAEKTGKNQKAYEEDNDPGEILIIGEEIFARSLATAVNHSDYAKTNHFHAYALWPDINEGLNEEELVEKVNRAKILIADPLFRNCIQNSSTRLIPFPHEGYSGRIFRQDIPLFTSSSFDIETMLEEGVGKETS